MEASWEIPLHCVVIPLGIGHGECEDLVFERTYEQLCAMGDTLTLSANDVVGNVKSALKGHSLDLTKLSLDILRTFLEFSLDPNVKPCFVALKVFHEILLKNVEARMTLLSLCKQYCYSVRFVGWNLSSEQLKSLGGEKFVLSLTLEEASLPLMNKMISISCPQLDQYEKCLFTDGIKGDLIVIGDVHEQVDSLKALLCKNGVKFRDDNENIVESSPNTIVFVGDLIDKGDRTRDIIEFIWSNRQHFIFVKGNHEKSVFKHLFQGQKIKANMASFFSSVSTLEPDEELKAKFIEIYNEMLPFAAFLLKDGNRAIVSHAPCHGRHLCKLDAESLRNQNYYFVDRSRFKYQIARSYMKFSKANANYIHLFGHVGVQEPFIYENLVFLDANSSEGQAIGYAIFKNGDSKELSVKLVPGEKILDSQSQSQCQNHVVKNVSKYWFPSRQSANDIGKLANGKTLYLAPLQNFYAKDLTEMADLLCPLESYVMQPIVAGMPCQVYLNCKDPSKSYAINGQGNRISQNEMLPSYNFLHECMARDIADDGISWIVFDGVLPKDGENPFINADLLLDYANARILELQHLEDCIIGEGAVESTVLEEKETLKRLLNLVSIPSIPSISKEGMFHPRAILKIIYVDDVEKTLWDIFEGSVVKMLEYLRKRFHVNGRQEAFSFEEIGSRSDLMTRRPGMTHSLGYYIYPNCTYRSMKLEHRLKAPLIIVPGEEITFAMKALNLPSSLLGVGIDGFISYLESFVELYYANQKLLSISKNDVDSKSNTYLEALHSVSHFWHTCNLTIQ